ncbi:hypothetical protein [Streptomyces sp. MUSC 14]|nr:hypothetical protein [Streptomyces sp. MUSC 14]
MRRIAAAVLGTVAFLAILATPASADGCSGMTPMLLGVGIGCSPISAL